jgi:hypothetical protein
MAGLIAALFGGRARRQVDTNPHPGIGGYNLGAGPANQTGFPGSTSQVRTYQGNNPRAVKARTDTNTGWESALSDRAQVRQASYRGDVRGANIANPRATPTVGTRQPLATELLQNNSPAEFYGGPPLRTRPGDLTAGGHPLAPAALAGGHSERDATTPWIHAQPIIGEGTPGSENVRNQIAQRYKAAPGQTRTYKSAARADQAPVNRGGQATDGNVHPDAAVTMVSVPDRFQMFGTGSQTWSLPREMPYGGRGDGARGADLNGQRFYRTGQEFQFANAGMGDYGIARKNGGDHKRPVSFETPAPWTANFYDTTQTVQDNSTPQAPDMVYVSPSAGRAGNGTGRS